jgi:hypothetical protein
MLGVSCTDKGGRMKRTIHIAVFFVILAAFGSVAGCDRRPQTLEDKSDSVKGAVAQLKAVYTWRGDLNRYDYSAKVELDKILSARSPESAVAALIECLDDTSASSSVLDGTPVSLGIVCYEGLSLLVYYEPTDAGGDVAANWPGFIFPQASTEDMRNAKAAWKRAQEAKLLIFQ